MFSSLRSKGPLASLVNSFDPAAHLKHVSKQIFDDPSVLNQTLRDICGHLSTTKLYDRADQTLGIVIASHASRHLSTLWTVLLQMLREATETKAQLCILKHFSNIANRIAIPQRINAFRVFGKEILSLCGQQDIVGDRQFASMCNATVAALGTHADPPLCQAILEKLLNGVFTWSRSDACRAAGSIAATLIFQTPACDSFTETVQRLQKEKRNTAKLALFVDSCIPQLLEQAVKLCPLSDPAHFWEVTYAHNLVSTWLLGTLNSTDLEPLTVPLLVSSATKLYTFVSEKGGGALADEDSSKVAIRGAVVRLMQNRAAVKKLLWCPVLSLLPHVGLSSLDPVQLRAELKLVDELSKEEDPMVRGEAFLAQASSVSSLTEEEVVALLESSIERHHHWHSERCNVSVRGLIRLISGLLQRGSRLGVQSDAHHKLLRLHMDLSSSLNTVSIVQVEVLELIAQSVGRLTGEAMSYLLLCLNSGDVKVRDKSIQVVIQLCREASVGELQLFEPTLRGVDFLEGCVTSTQNQNGAQLAMSGEKCDVLQIIRNLRVMAGYFYHQLVGVVHDTDKAENNSVHTISEVMVRLATEADAVLSFNKSAMPLAMMQCAGAPLEHCFYNILHSLFAAVSGPIQYPIDTACSLMEAMATIVHLLRQSTQFDIHFHKELFTFAWAILVQCCETIDPTATPKLVQSLSVFCAKHRPHPFMSTMIASAAQSAMSTSEQSSTKSFYRITDAALSLLRELLEYGRRSKVFLAHLKAQHREFIGMLDVVVSTHPVATIQCTKAVVRTLLTDSCTDSGVVVSPYCLEEFARKVVASTISVLNRSLSFDLIVVGKELFSFIELLIKVDLAAGWTTCYSTLDSRFQLFSRLVDISTDKAHYNAVYGPKVVPPIIRAVLTLLASPYRLNALESLDYEKQDNLLDLIRGLIHESHQSLSCVYLAQTLATLDLHESMIGYMQAHYSSAASVGYPEFHRATCAWLRHVCSDSVDVDTFIQSLGSCILAVDNNTDDDLKEMLFDLCSQLGGKTSNKFKNRSFTLSRRLVDHHDSNIANGTANNVFSLLCAAVLDAESTLYTAIKYLLSSITLPTFTVTDGDLCCLIQLLESSSVLAHIDGATFDLPSLAPWCADIHNTSTIVDANVDTLHVILRLLPKGVKWQCEDWVAAHTQVWSHEPLESLKECLLVVAIRTASPIPQMALTSPLTWNLLVSHEGSSTLVAPNAGEEGAAWWEEVGMTLASLASSDRISLGGIHQLADACIDAIPEVGSKVSLLGLDNPTHRSSPRAKENIAYLKLRLLGSAGGRDTLDDEGESSVAYDAIIRASTDLTSIEAARLLPHYANTFLDLPGKALSISAFDLEDLAAVVVTRDHGISLIHSFMSVCMQKVRIPPTTIVKVVSALICSQVEVSDVDLSAAECEVLFAQLRCCLVEEKALTQRLGQRDETLAIRYAAMFLLVVSSPTKDGQWERVLNPEATSELRGVGTDGDQQVLANPAWAALKPCVLEILAEVLELPADSNLHSIAKYALAIFLTSSGLSQGINESILWLVVKCCPRTVWACIVSQELCPDTDLACLRFITKMNQTVGVGTDLAMELHARYTPLLLSFGKSRDLDGDEQRTAFWLTTSLLLHIVYSEERHTKPKPHMGLIDALPMYYDFPLEQMCTPAVGRIRRKVDRHLFPTFFTMSIPHSERHWNIHTRGHLLPVLGRRKLAKSEADKMFSSILHMYLHVVDTVFNNLATFAPSTVSDVFFSLTVLASGNASLLKHSPSVDGTVATCILQTLFQWYHKHAESLVSSATRGVVAFGFSKSLFPRPSSSLEFSDTYSIISCVTVISSLLTKTNEGMPGAVDVPHVLDKMLGMDLISHQAALSAVVVMSSTSTRREMERIGPIFTQRLLKELDQCVKGSLSFSFGVMQLLRSAFSILAAFPDETVTMKVCEAVWNVVMSGGAGGRRIQHYAHFMLQSIVNMGSISNTQWNVLRAIVSLPHEEAARIAETRERQSQRRAPSTAEEFASQLFNDSASYFETGRKFIGHEWKKLTTDEAALAKAAKEQAGCLPVRTAIISNGMRRKATLAVAEIEGQTFVASMVYGSTANLLRLTTIASFVLRGSQQSGADGLEESDRMRVTVLDMFKQIDEEASAVGDVFLAIVYLLLRNALEDTDGMFVILNRFNFSTSSLFLFSRVLQDTCSLTGLSDMGGAITNGSMVGQPSTKPTQSELIERLQGRFSLFFETSSSRQQHVRNCWWVVCNMLAVAELTTSEYIGDSDAAKEVPACARACDILLPASSLVAIATATMKRLVAMGGLGKEVSQVVINTLVSAAGARGVSAEAKECTEEVMGVLQAISA